MPSELGEEPSEEELFSMISELDQDPGGKIGTGVTDDALPSHPVTDAF